MRAGNRLHLPDSGNKTRRTTRNETRQGSQEAGARGEGQKGFRFLIAQRFSHEGNEANQEGQEFVIMDLAFQL